MKKAISLLCIFILSFVLVSCSKEKEVSAPEDIVNPINVSISFSDSDKDAVEAEDFKAIAETDFIVEEGTSVLDATQLYCVANGLDITVNSSSGYISGMLGLNEGDLADTTGWIYTINGEAVTVSADKQILKEGDKIAWEFVDFSTYAW
ncbi:MAG: DUF4430 domain-containing protein [Firmicutes bacterium]|jgi:hypothetical protein|nr:DUF4430 domain-containing protein [Bacillota bacterium]